MWQQFTEDARRAVYYAQETGRSGGERDVTPQHLLLGVMYERDNLASRILGLLGADTRRVAAEACGTNGDISPLDKAVDMRLSARAKRVIDLSYDEARRLNRHIGSAHLLLGILREGGDAAQILRNNGVTLEAVRVSVNQPTAEDK